MPTITYASLPTTQTGVTFSVESGGSLTAGSAWFTAQGFTRAGYNLAQTPQQLTWSDGDRIRITIGTGARTTGADLYGIAISAAAANVAANYRRVAVWRGCRRLCYAIAIA